LLEKLKWILCSLDDHELIRAGHENTPSDKAAEAQMEGVSTSEFSQEAVIPDVARKNT
jgi:hypothetical protein